MPGQRLVPAKSLGHELSGNSAVHSDPCSSITVAMSYPEVARNVSSQSVQMVETHQNWTLSRSWFPSLLPSRRSETQPHRVGCFNFRFPLRQDARCSYNVFAVLISKLFNKRQQHVPCNVYLPGVAQTGLSNLSLKDESRFHARVRPPGMSEYLDTIVGIEVTGSMVVGVCSGTGASGCRDPSIEVSPKKENLLVKPSFLNLSRQCGLYIVQHIPVHLKRDYA